MSSPKVSTALSLSMTANALGNRCNTTLSGQGSQACSTAFGSRNVQAVERFSAHGFPARCVRAKCPGVPKARVVSDGIEICQMGVDASQVDTTVDRSKQVFLRDVILKRELVEKRRLRLLPWSHHRQSSAQLQELN